MSKKVFHLSHTDLDGYSCQLITKRCFENIRFYNSNYGSEIRVRIDQMINDIQTEGADENLLLITDLNLTMSDAKYLVKLAQEGSHNIELLLLDHHKTGADCANEYDWYQLDVKRCATKITYDWFLQKGFDIDDLKEYVDVVNAIDIWLKDQDQFELGKVFMKIVSSSREVNRVMFDKENSKYIFYLLQKAKEYIKKDNPHIWLDNDIHSIKKGFFKKDEDDTLDNLVSNFIVDMLTQKRDEFTIYYDKYKGILTYSIGNVSIIGNDFLVKNSDFDFFMDINGRGNISFRANDKADVSKISKDVFGGGGHANASGGRFETYKDSFIYDEIKSQVQEKLTIGENHG
ncbi:MAG: 3'-to-5' oligoribonuclease B [Sulfurospirillum sp.]|nr:MAG: 3'-to-5' oligoribonuclease B [Sulfurospirillum sp.]